MNIVSTKTVPLSVGNNTIYVSELKNNEVINLYTVTIRRKPVYTVKFLSENSTVESQRIEEDSLLQAPETQPEREGYTFAGWDYDFNEKITSALSIDAIWEPNTNTFYQAVYYLENLEDDGYTLDPQYTEYLYGTTGDYASAEIKHIENYTYTGTNTDSGIINADGSTLLKVYYLRNRYTVTYNGNGGRLHSGEETQIVKHGGSTTNHPVYEKTGYYVSGYSDSFTNITSDICLNAVWTKVDVASVTRREGDYIYFGYYPQTLKSDSVNITSVNGSGIQNYYWGSDGEQYAKVVGGANTTYYFKVEPLKWKILREENGKAMLLCDKVIDAKRYSPDKGGSSKYSESEIRDWLNNEFLNTAFNHIERCLIDRTIVDNSLESTGCSSNKYVSENTFDKVFLLSYVEVISSSYGFSDNASRIKSATHYAYVNGALIDGHTSTYYNADWWLRSPYEDARISKIRCDGNKNTLSERDWLNGIVPALIIQLYE